MHSFTPTLVALVALAAQIQARDVPSNIQSLYNSIKSQGTCNNKLATGFYSTDGGPNSNLPLSPSS